MKITFLDFDDIRNPLLGAGQAKATFEVGKRLVKKGHTVNVLCFAYPGSKDRVEEGIAYKHIGFSTKNIRINNALYILLLPFYVSRLKTDIVVECFTAPISTLLSPLWTKLPVVGLPTSYEAERFSKLYHLPFHLVEHFGSKLYKYFMPYTLPFDEKMKKTNPKIISRVIPEGVGDEFFQIKKKSNEFILFIGRFDIGQKGIDLLLHAYAKASKNISYPLVIAGLGPDEAKIRMLIRQLNLEKKVTFMGAAYGELKYDLLSRAVLVAMPSRHEGFSLFSLEALASGNGIAAFDIPGFSWADESVVMKAKNYSVNEYAQLLEMTANSSKMKKMQKDARAYALNYSWDNVAQEFEKFFIYILKKESRK
jgi:glycogen synthase